MFVIPIVVLDDEINVEDFEKWFPLIELHAQMAGGEPEKISKIKDDLCMLAVKNSLSEHTTKFKEESANYNLHPVNNEFLQSVSELDIFV